MTAGEWQPGEPICKGPTGTAWIAYTADSATWSAAYHRGTIIQGHPGDWTHLNGQLNPTPVPSAALAELAENHPDPDEHPPVLPRHQPLLTYDAPPSSNGNQPTGLRVPNQPDTPQDDEEDDQPYRKLKTGDRFVLDDPAELEPVWGQGDQVIWAAGEPFLVVGPAGVGKTTLAIQIAAGRLGIIDQLLGYPITPTEHKVLYLAMDRPRQIRRAMRRLFGEQHRDLLAERLAVWEGPLPADLTKQPGVLAELADWAKADTVIVDSLKDAVAKLSDDEAGSLTNRALQHLVADNIETFALHHQRKGQAGARPRTLEDVYGSTWITAGAGSVLLLWGEAGDPIVEAAHLKQPAAEIGPLQIEHDHHAGRSTVYRGQVDPLKVLRSTPGGLTARDLAQLMFNREPNDNQRKKAQRALDRLVRDNLAHRQDSPRTGQDNLYHPTIPDHQP